MSKGRLEAFSDGVIAVIITIMVLELQAPHGSALADLKPKIPIFLSYVLSFIFIGIYWNNHHHLLHAVNRVNGRVLWANLHLLFWLSLIPFATDWMGLNQWATVPVAVYGCLLFLAGAAYTILAYELIALEGKESTLARAMGRDYKGKTSLFLYAAAVPLAFLDSRISMAIYVLVAFIWLIPDRRIEKVVAER
ncbi:MAG TPA: TMEM175 family protein [Candidatus Saccharimonadales bacterium]|jgi:uncharacterized membrane protein|nr:TMEM175 family protein [Candidatus Saccharimonadales bacterium]